MKTIPKLGLPVYPFLAALVPVLLYYNTQATQEIPLDGLLVPCAFVVLVTFIIYFIPSVFLLALPKKANSAGTSDSARDQGSRADLIAIWALLVTELWLIFFSPTFCILLSGLCAALKIPFEPLAVAPSVMPLAWLVLLGIGMIAIVRRSCLVPITSNLQYLIGMLFLLEVLAGAFYEVRSDLFIKPAVESMLKEQVLEPATKSLAFNSKPPINPETAVADKTSADDASRQGTFPDIYYVVLDEMASSGVLEKYLHYDDSWFRKALRERHFFVATRSMSNYPLTRLSLSSSLNMMYLDRLAKITGSNNGDLTATTVLIRNNAVAKLLKQRDYTYVHIDSAVPPSDNSDIANLVLHFGWVNQFSDKLCRSTILALSPDVVAWLQGESRDRIRWEFATTADIAARRSDPKQRNARFFVFAHLLCPHEPFLFEADGTPTFNPGDRHGDRWTVDTEKAYVAQVVFAQRRVIETIDSILKYSKEQGKQQPVIIFQGDHGTHCTGYVSSNHPSDELLHERFGILNAYLVPENVKVQLNKDTGPVNTFRIILRTIFGYNLPDLPEKQFYSSYNRVFDFKDVTKTVHEGTPVIEE